VPPVRRPLRTLGICAALALGALGVGAAAPAGAQTTTTTTAPPVRSIPVTPAAPATTTTAAPAAVAATTSASAPLADTGIAADRLVPFGFLLIGLGAALVAAARRYGRPAFDFL
jgi:hypothetical protein